MIFKTTDLIIPSNFNRFIENGILNLDKLEKEPNKLLRLYTANVRRLTPSDDPLSSMMRYYTVKAIEDALLHKLKGYHLFKFLCHNSYNLDHERASELLKETVQEAETGFNDKSISRMVKAIGWLEQRGMLDQNTAKVATQLLKGKKFEKSVWTERNLKLYDNLEDLKFNFLCKKIIDASNDDLAFLKRELGCSRKNKELIEHLLEKIKTKEFNFSLNTQSKLDLVIEDTLTDEQFSIIEKTSPYISCIHYTHKDSMPDVSEYFFKVCKNLKRLEEIHFNCHTKGANEAIKKIADQFPTIETLVIGPNTKLTNGSFIHILKTCKNINALGLGSCELPLAALEKIPQHYPNLQVIAFKNCEQVTDEFIQKLTQGCKDIEKLNLSGCKKITDLSIEKIVQSYPNLQAIILDYCIQISDSAIEKLVQNCPKLQAIALNNCTQITDSTVLAIAKNCKNLEMLSMDSEAKLKGSTLLEIAKNCKSLKTFVACQQKGDNVFWEVRNLLPNCEVLIS